MRWGVRVRSFHTACHSPCRERNERHEGASVRRAWTTGWRVAASPATARPWDAMSRMSGRRRIDRRMGRIDDPILPTAAPARAFRGRAVLLGEAVFGDVGHLGDEPVELLERRVDVRGDPQTVELVMHDPRGEELLFRHEVALE